MVKSPEQYLSSFDFNLDPGIPSTTSLNSGERAFVEKYLGLDALETMPLVEPERPLLQFPHKNNIQNPVNQDLNRSIPSITSPSQPQNERIEAQARPHSQVGKAETQETFLQDNKVLSDEIYVAPAPQRIIPQPVEEPLKVLSSENSFPRIVVAPDPVSVSENKIPTPEQDKEKAPSAILTDIPYITDSLSENTLPIPSNPSAEEKSEDSAQVSEKEEKKSEDSIQAPEKEKPEELLNLQEKTTQEFLLPTESELHTQKIVDKAVAKPEKENLVTESVVNLSAVSAKSAQSVSDLIKDKLRQEKEIQMVSFLVSGQLFLLPVMTIQEVLRHTEIVKVPQAPAFVAGAINLRGHVTPLIHLAPLVTGDESYSYSEKNFIIICGSEDLQLGLIIDKISSMHMLPQDKIIWNVESKLGDGAEFLCAIANLDEKVCGILAPEIITQKLLAPQ